MAIEFDLTTGTFQTPNNGRPSEPEQHTSDDSSALETRLVPIAEQSEADVTHPCVIMAACYSLGK